MAAFGSLGLVTWIWYLFDSNVARPIDRLAGALRARAHTDVTGEMDADTAEAVRKTMERVSERFPAGIEYKIPYDTTKFVQISIEEVIKTFFEALVLVVLVQAVHLWSTRALVLGFVVGNIGVSGAFIEPDTSIRNTRLAGGRSSASMS